MTPFGWQHVKVKSTKSIPPSKVAKSVFMGTLFEQPPQAQIRPNAKDLCAHQIATDQSIIFSTENVQKVHSRPKLWAWQNWPKQLPPAQIGLKFKSFCAYQTIDLSPENVQKCHS